VSTVGSGTTIFGDELEAGPKNNQGVPKSFFRFKRVTKSGIQHLHTGECRSLFVPNRPAGPAPGTPLRLLLAPPVVGSSLRAQRGTVNTCGPACAQAGSSFCLTLSELSRLWPGWVKRVARCGGNNEIRCVKTEVVDPIDRPGLRLDKRLRDIRIGLFPRKSDVAVRLDLSESQSRPTLKCAAASAERAGDPWGRWTSPRPDTPQADGPPRNHALCRSRWRAGSSCCGYGSVHLRHHPTVLAWHEWVDRKGSCRTAGPSRGEENGLDAKTFQGASEKDPSLATRCEFLPVLGCVHGHRANHAWTVSVAGGRKAGKLSIC